jgi:aminoglycoside phosphotransferase family enzyme
MPSFDDIHRALARLDADPDHPRDVEIHETHISWVFLAGDRAYKLKKPLALEFVDYSSAERRRAMCREEVRLNQRLAPDIYLGVRGVAPTDAGLELTDDDDPRAVEYLVEMRRFDERGTLASALDDGAVEEDTMIAVGKRLAEFHRDAEPVPTQAPVLEVQDRLERNLNELLDSIDDPAMRDRVWALGHPLTHSWPAMLRRSSTGLGGPSCERVMAICAQSTYSSTGRSALWMCGVRRRPTPLGRRRRSRVPGGRSRRPQRRALRPRSG